MRTRQLNHSTYQHAYHIIWGTRARRKFLKPYVKEYFLIQLRKVVDRYPPLFLISANTDEDHVHLEVEIPPNMSVSGVVQKLKSETSRVLRKRYKFIDRMYIEKGIWSVGYYSSTVGITEEVIRKYVAYQGQEDLGKQLKL